MTIYVKPDNVVFHEAGADEDWAPAEIPGSVHLDLLALGRIPDPFIADNELQVQWVAERDWEYQVILPTTPQLAASQRVFLVCEGLDTLADVTFNGRELGHTDNMFRRYCWDVTELLAEGENEVQLYFASVVKYIQERQAEEPLIAPSQSIPGGPHVRKAPCQFGWDWGPQLPPTGIWKELRLEGYTTARLEDVALRQHHADGAVSLSADVTLERWSPGKCRVVMHVTAPDGETQEQTLELAEGETSGTLELEVADPQLWWPNGYGEQPLYQVEVTLYEGEEERDSRDYQVGLRTLELRREPDKYGESFTFVVNGVPVFAKGANWIPADSFPTRIADAQLEWLIWSAAAANMNMLRVWGGGLYEEERFYDLCDRFGILVWQDFTFACSVYPDDADFEANVRAEAVDNVRRLRHRASLALWCGNNEMEAGWVHWGWMERVPDRYRAAYDRMYHHLLPDLCTEEDPDTPYWPSSPSSGVPFENPSGVHAGDTHNWQVWHGNAPYAKYREHNSRFVSEFGFQSLPSLETIATYAEEEEWNMTSYMMEHHQRNAAGNGKIINYMTSNYRMPRDFPSLVYLTQLLQAEAVRTGVEFWRRNREITSGTLYWQLNDCWPVASWASLDYFGRWKALHYMARRFYAPLLLSAEEHQGEASDTSSTHQTGYLFQPQPGPYVDLYLTSDLKAPWEGTVRWSLETLDGEVLRSGEEAVSIAPVSATKVLALDFDADVNRDNERHVILVYELWDGDTRLSLSVLPFVPSKHLELRDLAFEAKITEVDDGYELALNALSLARFVELSLEGTEDPVFSDNYFDLPAGRTVTINIPAIEGWDAGQVRAALRTRSLVESY